MMEALSEGGQVVMQAVPQQVQVMQAGQVIQGANGQQIMVHTVAPGTQTGQGPLQQIQVLPVSSLQTATPQGQIVIQQPQQAQIIQTADGQTYIYQPVPLENALQQTQPAGKNY